MNNLKSLISQLSEIDLDNIYNPKLEIEDNKPIKIKKQLIDIDDEEKEEKESPEIDNCPICLEALNPDKNFVALPCSHKVHFECFISYINIGNNKHNCKCMLCRRNIKLLKSPQEIRYERLAETIIELHTANSQLEDTFDNISPFDLRTLIANGLITDEAIIREITTYLTNLETRRERDRLERQRQYEQRRQQQQQQRQQQQQERRQHRSQRRRQNRVNYRRNSTTWSIYHTINDSEQPINTQNIVEAVNRFRVEYNLNEVNRGTIIYRLNKMIRENHITVNNNRLTINNEMF